MNHEAAYASLLEGGAGTTAPEEQRRQAVEAIYATGHWLLSEARPKDAARVFHAMAVVAPADERTWLALGACHEAMQQPLVALEMYGIGRVLARPSVRCELARARALRTMDRYDDADVALESAGALADDQGDDQLVALVRAERGAP